MTKVLIIITPGICYTILRIFVQSILKLRAYLIFWFESFHLSSLLLTRKNTSNVDYFTFDNTNIKEITGLFFKFYNHSSCGCCSFRKKTSKPSSNNFILRMNKPFISSTKSCLVLQILEKVFLIKENQMLCKLYWNR